MNQLSISCKNCLLMFIILFSVFLILSSSLSAQENRDEALNSIKLKEVILFNWESEVSNIADKIPGGRLISQHIYMFDAPLEDFDSQVAKISFQRPTDASGNSVTHRWVRIPYTSIDELNSNFNSLIKLVSTYSQNSRNLGKMGQMDTVIQLIDNDGLGGFEINIRKNQSELELKIDITRFSQTRIK